MSGMQAVALALCWLGYGALHSLLASLGVKEAVARRFPAAMRGYRLAFNIAAAVLLIPPVVLTFLWRGPLLWQWRGGWAWVADALALAAVAGVVWSSRYYELAEFAGTAQWRARETGSVEQTSLRLSPLHRYVRHPWYALALIVLWTRDMDSARFVSALCITLYFAVGLRFEERKLLAFHGRAYARYRARVNALVPWPGRILTAAEARALVSGDSGRP